MTTEAASDEAKLIRPVYENAGNIYRRATNAEALENTSVKRLKIDGKYAWFKLVGTLAQSDDK